MVRFESGGKSMRKAKGSVRSTGPHATEAEPSFTSQGENRIDPRSAPRRHHRRNEPYQPK